MDKKNTLIGVALMAAAIAFLMYGNSRTPPPPAQPPATTATPAPGAPARRLSAISARGPRIGSATAAEPSAIG
jgi:hypothetical protein